MLLTHTAQENLYLRGLTRDGRPRMHVNFPDYWQNHRSEQAKGGPGEFYLEEAVKAARKATGAGAIGVVRVDTINSITGKLEERFIGHNIITDVGAQALLQVLSNTLPTKAPYLVLAQDVAAAQLSVATTLVATTSLSVTSTSGPLGVGGNPAFQTANAATTFQSNASNNGSKQNNNNVGVVTATVGTDTTYGTGIIISFGTANAEGVQGTTAAQAAGTINITSYTITKTHSINDWVFASPSATDNPTTNPSGAQFSTAITASPTGSGIGSRQIQLIYTFAAGTTPAGAYSSVYIANAVAFAAGVGYAHAPITPANISSTNGAQITYTVKM